MSRPVRPRRRWRSRLRCGWTARTTQTPTRCRSCSSARRGTAWCTCRGRRPRPTRTRATGASGWPGSRHRPRRRCAASSWRTEGSRWPATSGGASWTSSTPGCGASPRWRRPTRRSPRRPSPRPTLVLRAAYGGDHALALEWEWAYPVGDTQARFPLPFPPRTTRSAIPPRSAPCSTRSTSRRSRTSCCGPTVPARPCCPASGSTGSTPCGSAPRSCPCSPTRRASSSRSTAGPPTYRETGDLAAGRRLHHGVGRRAPTGSTWASGSASRAATCRSPRSSPPSPRGRRTCSCRTGRTSPCTSRSSRRCARSSRRHARCRTRRRARCGSAASRRACGRSWPRSAWSTPRRVPGSSRSRACWRSTGSRRPHSRPASARSCGPTSARGSTGCASSGGTGSAACSPTTWGWARRCRRWPSSATRARSSPPGIRS